MKNERGQAVLEISFVLVAVIALIAVFTLVLPAQKLADSATSPAVAVAHDVANAVSIETQNGDQVALAKQVVVPNGVPGFPAPDHVKNRPEGPYVSALRTAAWNTVYKLWAGGRKPDWCGKRDDGTLLIVFYQAVVQKTSGGIYQGLAVLLNGVTGPSTSVVSIKAGEDGRPRGNTYQAYNPETCPPGPVMPAF